MPSNQFLHLQMVPKQVLTALPKLALSSSPLGASFEKTVLQAGGTWL